MRGLSGGALRRAYWQGQQAQRPLAPVIDMRTRQPLTDTPPGMGFTPAPLIRVDQPRLIDVVHWMRRLVHQGAADPRVRALAEKITADLLPGDYAGEAYAIYCYCLGNRGLTLQRGYGVRYTRDPVDIEYLTRARELLERMAEDCDGVSVLIAALLRSIGQHSAFCVAAYDGAPEPSHVFAMVRCPDGSYRPLDTVANKETSKAYRRMTWHRIIPV
jgi:hypothetical protein